MAKLKKILCFLWGLAMGYLMEHPVAAQEAAAKKAIVNHYAVLQTLTQNSLLGDMIENKKKNTVVSPQQPLKTSIQLSVEQFRLSLKHCKSSLTVIKRVLKDLKALQDPLAQECQTLYTKGKLIKNQLEDLHFTPSSQEGVQKLLECEEVVHNVVKLLEKSSSFTTALETPDSFKSSALPQTVAKPLTGEKLPEKDHKKRGNLQNTARPYDPSEENQALHQNLSPSCAIGLPTDKETGKL